MLKCNYFEFFKGLSKAASASNINSSTAIMSSSSNGPILGPTGTTSNVQNSIGAASAALSLTNLSSMFSKQRRRSLFVRALFTHDPSRDSGIPGRGLAFEFGDILHIVNASDEEWWQARRVNSDGSEEDDLGIVPSRQRVERKERARQRRVIFRKSLVVDQNHESSTIAVASSASTSSSVSSKSSSKRGGGGGGVLKIFKKSRKKDHANSGDELSDQERKYQLVLA